MEENKELEDFIRKSIKAVGLEEPSAGFTNSILSKIAVEQQKDSIFVTKPLFSKATWFFTITTVVALFGYVIFGSSNTESTWLAVAELNKLASYNLSMNVPKLSFSIPFIYGSIMIALFVWIQVFLLKNRLNKRFVKG